MSHGSVSSVINPQVDQGRTALYGWWDWAANTRALGLAKIPGTGAKQ